MLILMMPFWWWYLNFKLALCQLCAGLHIAPKLYFMHESVDKLKECFDYDMAGFYHRPGPTVQPPLLLPVCQHHNLSGCLTNRSECFIRITCKKSERLPKPFQCIVLVLNEVFIKQWWMFFLQCLDFFSPFTSCGLCKVTKTCITEMHHIGAVVLIGDSTLELA